MLNLKIGVYAILALLISYSLTQSSPSSSLVINRVNYVPIQEVRRSEISDEQSFPFIYDARLFFKETDEQVMSCKS